MIMHENLNRTKSKIYTPISSTSLVVKKGNQTKAATLPLKISPHPRASYLRPRKFNFSNPTPPPCLAFFQITQHALSSRVGEKGGHYDDSN